MLKMSNNVKVNGKNRSVITTMAPDASHFETALVDWTGHKLRVLGKYKSYSDAVVGHKFACGLFA